MVNTNYQYEKIISHSGNNNNNDQFISKSILNGGRKLSPVNHLMVDEKSNKVIIDNNNSDGYRSQFFHHYSSSLLAQNNNINNKNINKGFSTIIPVTQQQQQVGYQTTGIVDNNYKSVSNNYVSTSTTYKPLLATTQYFDQRYTTLSRQAEQQQLNTTIPSSSLPMYSLPSIHHNTYQHQQSHYMPQSNYLTLQSSV